MAAATPTCTLDLLDLLKKSRIWPEAELASRLEAVPPVPEEPSRAAAYLVKHGLLTAFQARVLLTGKYRGFRLGAYVIRDQIGQGGMGAVFLAQHETLRRPVAIKVLAAGEKGPTSKVNVERFLREARSAAALDHPNIVRIFDVAQLGETHYLVMEYVEGQTLDQMLTAGGPVACGRAVEYVLQAAAGLEHAAQKGFIHRDIKPANLILAKDGTVKILDMGLARSEETEDKVTEAFDRGAVVGTADFISPEQAMNAPDLDIRTDIYSLGATFYTLVTGAPPFRGNTTQKLMQHQIKDAPPLDARDKTFPPGLAAVVSKMMRKRPADRYQSPGEVMAALGPWLPNTAHVVAALSRADSRSSIDLQQTLNEVVSGSTKRLPRLIAKGDRKIPASALPYVVAGVTCSVLVLAAFVGLAVVAFSGSSEKGTVAVSPPPVWTPPAANPAAAPAPFPATRRSPATPTPATSRASIFAFDAAPLTAFRETWKSVPKTSNPDVLDQVVVSASGDGALPEGWLRMNYKPGTVSEVAVRAVGGKNALGVTTLEGQHTTMLFTPTFAVTRPSLRVTIEYLIEGADGAGQLLFAKLTPTSGDGWAVAELPPTDGKWASREFDFDPQGATSGRFEFHTHSIGDGKTTWVRSVLVTEASPAKSAAAAAGPRSVVDSFDAQAVPNFREQFRSSASKTKPGARDLVVLGRTGDGKLPAGWRLENYKDDTVSEVAVDTTDGVKALGLTTLEGFRSTMLHSPPFAAASPNLTLKIEYMAEGAEGHALVRFVHMEPWENTPAADLANLPASNGQWVVREFPVDAKTSTRCRFEFHTCTLPLGKTVWVKSYSVTGGDPASARAPDALPAGHKVLFRSDFGALGPFREKARSTDGPNKSKIAKVLDRSGDGQFPADWQLMSWDPDTVHEVSVGEVHGSQALAIRTVSGKPTTMLFTPRVAFPGPRVRVRIEYALPGGSGECVVRLRQLAPEFGDVWDVAKLDRTAGAWQVADFDLEVRDATAGHLEFHTTLLPEGEAVGIKSVTVYQSAE